MPKKETAATAPAKKKTSSAKTEKTEAKPKAAAAKKTAPAPKAKAEKPAPKAHAEPKAAKTASAPAPKPDAAPVSKPQAEETAVLSIPAPAVSAATPAPAEPSPAPASVGPLKTEPVPVPASAPAATAPAAETLEEAPAKTDGKTVTMRPPIVVKDLAVRLGIKPFQLVHQLMEMNIFATLTQTIDEDVAKTACAKFGFVFEVEKREKGAGLVHAPVKIVEPPKPEPVPVSDLQPRPPVITFMGHVDHGKTSLLDAIRQARVAAGEAGGITQHIGAYTVKRNNHSITFLDTPGHEAFTAMRARGANVTDIVVLVVAADDGLMPQTLEAISHARAAKAPLMIAINKIDLPGANVNRVKGQLQEQGLVPEDYGGDTICCEVSATKGVGIEKLLEMMLLQSEILELKANPKGYARGSIIESQYEQGRGPTATALVQHGTLKVGDAILCGPFYGRVRALINDVGQTIKEAGPSTPVKILGLDGTPIPGEEFTIMRNEREARGLAEERANKLRLGKLEAAPKVTLENLFDTIADGQRKVMKIVLKGDVQGSVEAIIGQLKKIDSKKIDIEFVHTAVGAISESDILLAKASQAIVIGFNTKTDNAAANAAKREDVQIKLYSIIYELIDQVKEAMAGLLDPETRETVIGTALVKQVFKLSKYPVAGCSVQTGRILRSARARVVRRKQPIYDGGIQTLKRFQDEASEVRAGLECGLRLGDFNEYQVDDVIECYQLEKFAQTL
jgi:translation initiation factor IF-2